MEVIHDCLVAECRELLVAFSPQLRIFCKKIQFDLTESFKIVYICVY